MVSPILRYGDIETLQEIVRALRREGAFANDSCGIHVHVDAAAHTPKTLRTLSNIVASKEELLYRALGVGRSRVEPQVREPHAVEALPAERGDLGVQALAQARDLGLRHGRHAESPRHLLDLARGDAEHVHLGHRGDERAVRPAVALYEVLGEERPRPQLRDPDPYVPCGREQVPLPVAVAAGLARPGLRSP